MAKSPHISRNDFVKVTVGALGTIMGMVVGLPAIGYIISPALKLTGTDAWIAAGPLKNYPVGTPTPFSFTRTKLNGWEKTVNSYGVYVLRKSESETDVLVLSNVCTHLACRVTWKEDVKAYVCPCHDGHFDINGTVINHTVPPRPLDKYLTKIESGNLFIHLVGG
jgi:menaquinol-cytochrome c reductase iron-sulfur subunit